MTVPGNIDTLLLGGQQGYQISRSLRFNSADSAYCSRAPWSGNRRLHTFSLWVKRTAFGSRQTLFCNTNPSGLYGLYFEFNSDDTLLIGDYSTSWQWQLSTTARYRDPSAWYHIVLAVDTANATAANRVKLYVNGSEVTAFSTASYMSQNYDTYWNYNSYTVAIGRLGENASQYFNGYLTEINVIDGQALTPSSFGETDTITGVWKPKKYSGSGYGTNGFYLNFSDNSDKTATTLGKDYSGNGNNWTPSTTFSVTAGAGNDSLIDTPTPYADGGNGRGNYAILSPLSKGDDATLSNGNLDVSYGSAPYPSCTMASFGMSSGKWYWETTITASSLTNTGGTLGISNTSNSTYAVVPQYPGYSANTWGYSGNTGTKYNNGTSTSYGSTFGVNDVIGCAFDADTGKIWWSKNGTWQASGDPAAGTNAGFSSLAAGTYFPAVGDGGGTSTFSASYNFGQRAFAYTPPSGFVALNTQNLPEPSIKKPSSYFDAKLYTGNGSTQTISGMGFSPDLVWIKNRSHGRDNNVYDSVRGATKLLSTNSTTFDVYTGTGAEQTVSGLTAFNSTGFDLGSNNVANQNTYTYVAWCWDESATPGFDIVTYTGTGVARTIAHSLGVAPKMIIVKGRTNADHWFVYNSNLTTPTTQYLYLNLTSAATSGANPWNSTNPTSSVFSLGTDSGVNGNGTTYVAYLWSEVAGFSKFGSYTGNGSSDGPFVFCGFRPRWVMLKVSSGATQSWTVFDTARDPYNVAVLYLHPNEAQQDAQFSTTVIDILSNGFKVRGTTNAMNTNSATYIFAAFAEAPFKYALAR